MTDRTLLQQALDALHPQANRAFVEATRDALRAALAQPEPEPVAWCELTPNGSISYFDGKPMIMVGPVGNEHHTVPLFTSPPAAPAPAPVVPPCHIAVVGFRFNPERQTHTPSVLLEFEPVPVGAPNDAQGWKDRDALVKLIAAAPAVQPCTSKPVDSQNAPDLTHKPTVQRLTNGRLLDIALRYWGYGYVPIAHRAFARAIEQAHGIGTQGGGK